MAKESKDLKPKTPSDETGYYATILKETQETPYDDVLFNNIREKWTFSNSSRGSGTVLRLPPTAQSEVLVQAERLRRAHEWVKKTEIGKEWAANDKGLFIEMVPKMAAPILVGGLISVYLDKTEGKGFTEERAAHLQARLPVAYEEIFQRHLKEYSDFSQELITFYEWLALIFTLDAIEYADGIGGSDDEWEKAFDERFGKNREDTTLLVETIISYGQSLAHQFLIENDPLNIPLEDLLGSLGGLEDGKDGSPGLEMTSEALSLSPEALMAVDYNAHAIVRHLAGRSKPTKQLENGFSLLEVKQPRGQRRQIAVKESLPPGVIEIIHPDDANSALERILNEKNINKAKTFLGILSCASQDDINPSEFLVMIEDIMRLVFGYEKTGPNKTRSDYWHKGVAEIIKYLALDLPGLQIHTHVILPYEKEPVVANDYLMHRPVIYTKQALLFDSFTQIASTGSDEDLINYLKQIEVVGFQIGFPKAVLASFGALRGSQEANALESVPKEVLALKGTTFWLAYDVAFLRRWSPPKKLEPRIGKKLLSDVLDTIGYVDATARGERNASYKEALRLWLKDVGALIDIGMLDRPGAKIYQKKAGRWKVINGTVDGWLKNRGTNITREKLEGIRIIYAIPEERQRQLAEPRKKAKSIRQAAVRAKAANNGRSKASKESG